MVNLIPQFHYNSKAYLLHGRYCNCLKVWYNESRNKINIEGVIHMKQENGYTLIEVVIVLAMVGIVITVGYVGSHFISMFW